jgi:3-methyladenine DNA glycosylase AlkD
MGEVDISRGPGHLQVGRAGSVDPAGEVVTRLRQAADPERRAHSTSYFPTSMEILGVCAADMRGALRPLVRALAGEPPSAVMTAAHALIATRIHEARQVAFELVGARGDVVASLSARAVERLGRGNDNWASVDCFGVWVAGPAWRDGQVRDVDVLGWATSDDRWWRRTALVSTVALNVRSRGGKGDPARTLTVCDALSADRDVMVAKGLSWALRALVPVAPASVSEFLDVHRDEVAASVRREVTNKLETGTKSGRRR